jgi:hypothetical protein
MKMRRTLIAGLLLVWATTASAQTPSDAADTYFRQGNGLYKEQRWADARTAFESAWKLKKAHDIAANLAYAEMKLGRWRDAAEHLAFAVKSWPPTGKADKRDYAIERLQAAKREVSTVTIQVDVARADVLVDGALVGQSPLADEVFVDPGPHRVEAKLDGYDDGAATVQAEKGGAEHVTLALVRTPPAPKPGPREPLPLPPPPVRPPTWLLVTTGVLAVGGLAAGTGLAVAAGGKRADAEALRTTLGGVATACTGNTSPNCTALLSDLRSRDAMSTAAVGSFVAGGVLAAATIGLGAWALVTPRDEKNTVQSFRVAPMLGANGGGITVRGMW